MAVTMNRGLVTTADPLAYDRVVSMREELADLDKSTTQFFTMLDRISTEEASSFKEEWLMDQYLPTNLSVSASIPTAGTAIADLMSAEDPLVYRGPDLGPLTETDLRADHCHLTAEGATFVGSQIAAVFDAP